MLRGDENCRVAIKPTGFPMEGVKYETELAANGGQRRAFRDIGNSIAAGAGPLYHRVTNKNDLSRKNEMHEKNSKAVAAGRPMTRSFAASLTNQPQSSQQIIQGSGARHGAIGCERQQKAALTSDPISNNHRPIAIDADELPLPMIEEIEDMINCDLKEVEMEDLEEQQLPDIDSCDAKNPLAVVDYVEDIYDFYRRTEDVGCVSPDYMSKQFDINEKMRAILIDWLIEVHYKFELMDQTLFLTVNIIDRFLARQAVMRKKLQLVGVTAMFLACKYEEVSVPVVEDLILISDRAYTRAEVLEMEKLIVKTLQFNLSVPTPYVFMRRFLKAAEYDKKLEMLSFFLVELCLVDYRMLKFRPSFLAAAAVYTAQCTLKGFKQWSASSEMHSQYSENQLVDCSRMMVDFHQKAGQGQLTAVLRKYSMSKFGSAATFEPALFLLDAENQKCFDMNLTS